jgi:hypothetical protein
LFGSRHGSIIIIYNYLLEDNVDRFENRIPNKSFKLSLAAKKFPKVLKKATPKARRFQCSHVSTQLTSFSREKKELNCFSRFYVEFGRKLARGEQFKPIQ